MRLRTYIYIVIPALAFVLLQSSCKKERILSSGGALAYSIDTLTFDTVFTAMASFTTQVKIYNKQNQKVTLSSVRLEKGDKSYFHINVNGYTDGARDIEIAANDSIYVFATVNVDPTDVNTPFIITDNLIANLNGKDYTLPFIAYGQNAHYIIDSVLETQTWLTDKPYVIIRNALVDSGHTLTIPAGCRIYVNADSRLFVAGKLEAIGTKQDSIIFQGDRLDRKYYGNEGYPGEWGGLYFTGQGTGSILNYVILRNCGGSTSLGQSGFVPAAIQVNYSELPGLTLDMRNTIIENSIGYGLLCFTGTVYAQNCLINTSGAVGLAITQGGLYQFDNCTFVTYGTGKVSHNDLPTVVIQNFYERSENDFVIGPLNCTLNNCIAYGSLETEIDVTRIEDTGVLYELNLNNCLIKTKDAIPNYVTQKNCIINQDPKFVDYQAWNYRPQEGSPLINKGLELSPPVSTDLDGNIRNGIPDIGCYEFK